MPSRDVQDARRQLIRITPTPAYRNAAEDLSRELPKKRTYWERRHGLTKMAEYITASLRELDGGTRPFGFDPPLDILEVGPGVGMWMEYVRELGHEVEGIDAPPANARMQIFEEMTTEAGLSVAYIGFESVMDVIHDGGDIGHRSGCYHMIHFRGSFDAVVGKFTDEVREMRTRRIAEACVAMLKPGGLVHVCHNRNGMMESVIETLRGFKGLKFEQLDDQTTRHWKA